MKKILTTLIAASILFLSGCDTTKLEEAERERQERYYAPFRRCTELNGIPRPGTSNGYSRPDIYGGCDFVPADRLPKVSPVQ